MLNVFVSMAHRPHPFHVDNRLLAAEGLKAAKLESLLLLHHRRHVKLSEAQRRRVELEPSASLLA